MTRARPRIAQYVYFTLPLEVGYTIRTEAIAAALAGRGYPISVIDQVDADPRSVDGQGRPLPSQIEVAGVPHLRAPDALAAPGPLRNFRRGLKRGRHDRLRLLCKRRDIEAYVRWLAGAGQAPEIVHAHSPPVLAHEAARVARRFGARLLYEVRGFWNLSRAAEAERAVDVPGVVAEDVAACRRADHVAAISRGIADHLVAGGIPASRVSLVPNGVDTRRFRPRPRDAALAQRLGLEGRVVFGYATSVRRLEGVQTLVEAWPEVLRRLPEAVFVLLGQGLFLEELRASVERLGIEESFRLLGRVPREEIDAYYSLLDVFVVPRVPVPVCEIVTPLKPLEAMAMGIPVLSSDVAALRELVSHGETGWLFRAGDARSAAEACVTLGRDPRLRAELAAKARRWVESERDWSLIAKTYAELYEALAG